ncbi:MAG: hypothetical protein JWM11_4174 [Planctomycetaceae bacterium]|nr:hypothetical protein [Planctomycetaceae bacterium]
MGSVTLPTTGLVYVDANVVIYTEIHSAFTDAADFTMYGFINAVTQVAHALRSKSPLMHKRGMPWSAVARHRPPFA